MSKGMGAAHAITKDLAQGPHDAAQFEYLWSQSPTEHLATKQFEAECWKMEPSEKEISAAGEHYLNLPLILVTLLASYSVCGGLASRSRYNSHSV